MSASKRRLDFIKTIVAGSVISSDLTVYPIIIGEFNEVERCKKINIKKRKFVLMVLHSTRALDSALKCYLDIKGLRTMPNNKNANTLGQYLGQFERSRYLSGAEKIYYQRKIVDIRNVYMHVAGSYPSSENEIYSLLSEMQACLTRTIR